MHWVLSKIIVGVLLLTGSAAYSQSVTNDWGKITCGSGISTAGVYTVVGTLGPAGALKLNSKDFSIDSGVSAVIAAVQEPGAPNLTLRITKTNTVVVSWAQTWPSFVLRENTDVGTGNWVNVAAQPNVIVVDGEKTTNQVIVPLPNGNHFYRLVRP